MPIKGYITFESEMLDNNQRKLDYLMNSMPK